eukprot:CAMPEP_0175082904 /NCGR_PEP_ID=MMETSP0052_2-20121109/27027_1 /TAXON_ID=51329 ORGANISM="Polytomella parva, Strain SAG 63-3" /NCGR_SAMPLE_ID=MMETSP0052_2 /ASSEMBLY_ACC=CAM_ASM_000194 /LENGTH=118 /DNA_ID=CAMNT_0016354177 /DNA_START=137 /DNA_END=493 /DNA_ORIENTATION=+
MENLSPPLPLWIHVHFQTTIAESVIPQVMRRGKGFRVRDAARGGRGTIGRGRGAGRGGRRAVEMKVDVLVEEPQIIRSGTRGRWKRYRWEGHGGGGDIGVYDGVDSRVNIGIHRDIDV